MNKPRLRKYKGRWYCESFVGETPEQAYRIWNSELFRAVCSVWGSK